MILERMFNNSNPINSIILKFKLRETIIVARGVTKIAKTVKISKVGL